MTPDEICDRVFGEYTKNSPTPREDAHILTSIIHPWEYYFDGERPDWYQRWMTPDDYKEAARNAKLDDLDKEHRPFVSADDRPSDL